MKFEFTPSMLDYQLDNKDSLRYKYIREIEDKDKKIREMSEFLKEVINQPFPDELYEWVARDTLGYKYKKYEIKDMRRKEKIKQKRIKKKKEEDERKIKELEKIKKTRMTKSFGSKLLVF